MADQEKASRIQLPALGRLRSRVMLLFLAALAIVWSGVLYQLASLRAETLTDAQRDGDNVAALVAAHFSSFAATIDLWLGQLRLQWLKDPEHFAGVAGLETSLLPDSPAFQASIVDKAGYVVYSTLKDADRFYAGDVQHISAHLASGADVLYISSPVRGRISRKVSLKFSRPILGASGELRGVVVLSISPQYLVNVYKRLALGPRGSITLRRPSGEVLIRSLNNEETAGTTFPAFPPEVAGREAGSFTRIGFLEDTSRLFNFRKVAGQDVYAVVSTPLDVVLGDYYKHCRRYLVGATLISAVLFLLFLLAARSIRQEGQATRALSQSEDRFRGLTRLSSDWYWETDPDLRVTQFDGNANVEGRYAPASTVVGRYLWELPGIDAPSVNTVEQRAVLERRQAFRKFEYSYVTESGRRYHVSAAGEPFFAADGSFAGYRGTSRDITARKAAQAMQATQLRLQERVVRLGHSALRTREVQGLIDECVQAVLEACTASAVAYVEFDADIPEPRVRAAVGLDGSWQVKAAQASWAALRLASAADERHMVSAAQVPFSSDGSNGTAVLVPVQAAGRRGVLCVCNDSEERWPAERLNFVDSVASVMSTALQRIDSEAKLSFLAQFDTLTRLPNRALLNDRFEQMILAAQRYGRQLAALFLDLDDFKMVNDTLGHVAGDELLREAGARLTKTVRPGDVVARMGGDEFAIVLGDLTGPEDATLVGQRLIAALADAFQVRGHELFVTASIGIALFPDDGQTPEALLAAADAAMYRAKQFGRNGVQFFTAELTERSRARLQLGAQLRQAIERNEFVLVYQPKISLRTGKVCAAEALLRWKHPERGMVSPAEFIPILEESGLIVSVGDWVVRQACQDIRALGQRGVTPVPIAVNLSPRQFRQSDLDGKLKSIIREAEVDPALMELEITESHLMHDPQKAAGVMQRLRAAGIRLSIDDFGTGYSSLSYLSRFPVNSLKIDRSFVAELLTDPADAAIVRAIIDMAHTLGFVVIAEGVETAEQVALLTQWKCDQAQGFHFAAPVPLETFASLLAGAARQPDPPRAAP